MNFFEMNILNDALLKVQSAADAASLAKMVMKLAKTSTDGDAVLDSLEERFLAALITQERQKQQPSFQNINPLAKVHPVRS
jgi:hypothetical protein